MPNRGIYFCEQSSGQLSYFGPCISW